MASVASNIGCVVNGTVAVAAVEGCVLILILVATTVTTFFPAPLDSEVVLVVEEKWVLPDNWVKSVESTEKMKCLPSIVDGKLPPKAEFR